MKKFINIVILLIALQGVTNAQDFVLNNPVITPAPGVFPGGKETVTFDFYVAGADYTFSSIDLNNSYTQITFSFTKMNPTTVVPSGSGAVFFNWVLTSTGTFENTSYTYTGTTKTATMLQSPTEPKYKIIFANVPITYASTSAQADVRVAGQFTNPGNVSTSSLNNSAVIATYTVDAVTIAGVVFDDANGNATKDGVEPFTNAGGLFANLVALDGNVLESVAVDPTTGAYLLVSAAASTSYNIVITTTDQTGVTNLTTSSLPTATNGNWVNTGVNINGTASTSNKTGIIPVTTAATGSLSNQNFAIEKRPTAAITSHPPIVNNGFTQPLNPATFSSADVDGSVTSLLIVDFPATLQSITIGGTKYLASNWPVGGVSLPVSAGVVQTSIGVIGITGATTGNIPFIAIDNAGVQSAVDGRVNLTFTVILPVTGLSLKGQLNNAKKAMLQWRTFTESNTAYFEIERKDSKSNTFVSIGKVAAAGNSNEQLAYSFMDAGFIAPISYYRLKLYDKDGKWSYSNEVALSATGGVIQLYPNPTKDRITVSGIAADTQLQLVTLDGRILQNIIASGAQETIYLGNITTGVYLIKVLSVDKAPQTFRIIKK